MRINPGEIALECSSAWCGGCRFFSLDTPDQPSCLLFEYNLEQNILTGYGGWWRCAECIQADPIMSGEEDEACSG
jgi:hypothetical protein